MRAIPPSRRAQLEKRRAADLRNQGGIGGLRARQRDRSKAPDGAEARPCSPQDMHTIAERGRATEAAGLDVKSRQVGDQPIVGAKRCRGSSGRDDLLTERDSRRLRPRNENSNDENFTHDGFYARRWLGGRRWGPGGGRRRARIPGAEAGVSEVRSQLS